MGPGAAMAERTIVEIPGCCCGWMGGGDRAMYFPIWHFQLFSVGIVPACLNV